MTATNKTTYYDLSQYVESDRPTYLGDYNSDMSKIDAALHQIATETPEGGITAVSHDGTLDGDGTGGNPLKIADSYTTGLEADINGKADAEASQPGTLGLTAKQLDNLFADTNGIVRVGNPTA